MSLNSRQMHSDETNESNWYLHSSGWSKPTWFGDLKEPLKYDRLAQNISVDVAIVGGGIAGVTTAYLIYKSGKTVALLEDGYTGSGETGRTTAHITHALDDRYYNIVKKHGENGAKLAAESHTAAMHFIDRTVREESIDCGYERLNGYLFLNSTDKKSTLEKELNAIKNAGISGARLINRSPLEQSDLSPCILFPDQAQFQPMLYLKEIAQTMTHDAGVQIFTETHVQEIKKVKNDSVIITSDGNNVTG